MPSKTMITELQHEAAVLVINHSLATAHLLMEHAERFTSITPADGRNFRRHVVLALGCVENAILTAEVIASDIKDKYKKDEIRDIYKRISECYSLHWLLTIKEDTSQQDKLIGLIMQLLTLLAENFDLVLTDLITEFRSNGWELPAC